MKKKILALLLALTMVLGLAANIHATEPGIVDEGFVYGGGWRLTDDGNLYVERNCDSDAGTAPWEKYKEQITTVTLGGGIYITHLFNDMPNLTSVHFEKWPYRVEGSFKNCPKLTSFTNGEEYGNMTCKAGYIIVNEDTITRAPTGLSGTVYIPDFVTDIRSRAFIYCHQIEELVLPEGFDAASEKAFMDCANLKTVVFPTTTRYLSSDVFHGCNNLESIYFTGDAPDVLPWPATFVPIFGDYNENRIPRDTRVTANVYYPADNETWTEEVREAFGGLVTWIPYNPANPFRDVPVDAFYEEPVLWALENNITSGATATTFNPGGECLRAQVVTFLWRAAGCPMPTDAENPFEDVTEGDYYYNAVLWAVEQGITAGVDATHFAPMQSCSRAQVVAFLYRAMGSPKVSEVDCPFTDVEAGEWYELPVLWAVENGITAGLTPDTFGVNTVCNRAQVVTFLYRTYHK